MCCCVCMIIGLFVCLLFVLVAVLDAAVEAQGALAHQRVAADEGLQAALVPGADLDIRQRGVQWMGGAVDWGSII